MVSVLTAAETRIIEERAVEAAGVTLEELMQKAGESLARHVIALAPTGRIVVLAGPGNNGGDGWVCAATLERAGRDVRVLSVRDPSALAGIAARAARAAIEAGVAVAVPGDGPIEQELSSADVVVDALLGTGASSPLRPPIDRWCRALRSVRAPIIAADLPTGVDADTGAVVPEAVRATRTVTFLAPKRGLYLYPGASCAGEVVLESLGLPEELTMLPGAPELWEVTDYARRLPRWAPDVHKNARGRVLIVAGSGRYPGAAVLAAVGAARCGAGYVTVAAPDAIVPTLQSHLVAQPVVGLPSGKARTLTSAAARLVLELAAEHDAVLIGPGLTVADGAVACVRSVVARVSAPLVIDADGLNALVDAVDLLEARTGPTVLTPHPGELARLFGVSASDVQRDRVSSARRLAARDRVVVLKGAHTLASDGERTVIVEAGCPSLATAGTGDVLAGMAAALLAQGLGPFDAAALGAFLHGRAGEHAERRLGRLAVTAEDVPGFIGVAARELEAESERVRERAGEGRAEGGWDG